MTLLASLLTQVALNAFHPGRPSKPIWACALGMFFITLGSTCGCYFIFNYFVPQFGYIPTGLAFSGLFLGVGALLLSHKPKKKPESLPDLLTTAKNSLEEVNVDKIIHQHSGKILIGSIVAGVVLSQIFSSKK